MSRTGLRSLDRDSWVGYGIAIAATAAAWWLRAFFAPLVGDRFPFSSFFIATALTAWFGGYGPCLLSVTLGTFITWYFILPPAWSFKFEDAYQAFGLFAFVVTGLVIAGFSGRVRTSLRNVSQMQKEAVRRASEAEEAERRLHSLLSNVPEGITLTGGPPDFPIVAISDFAKRAIGDAALEVVGTSAGEHAIAAGVYKSPGKTAPSKEAVPLYRATRLGEHVQNEEWILHRQDGIDMRILCNAVPIYDMEGNIAGAVSC